MAPKGIHAGLIDSLGQRIADHQLPPGSVLSLAGIEAEYGVSRTVAREAMRLLEAMGMLEARRRVGLIVTPHRNWRALNPKLIEWRLKGVDRDRQLASLLDLRIAIEPTAARLAAENATPSERAALTALAAEIRRLGDTGQGTSPDYLKADVLFHTTLLEASRNELLATMKQVVEAVLVGRTEIGLTPSQPTSRSIALHEAVANAITRGDGISAEELCRTLVSMVRAEHTVASHT